MKIELGFLKNINVPGVASKRSGKKQRELVHPSREWETSLLLMVLLALGLFTFAGVDFYEQYTDSNNPVVSEEHIPKYRAQEAQSLIRYHDGRKEAFDALRGSKPVAKPPEVEIPETKVPEGSTPVTNPVMQ